MQSEFSYLLKIKMNSLSKKKKKVNVVYSGHALSFEIASLGMPLKHRKQITLNEHNMVKNPNSLRTNALKKPSIVISASRNDLANTKFE